MVGRGGNSRNWLSPLFMLIHYSMAKYDNIPGCPGYYISKRGQIYSRIIPNGNDAGKLGKIWRERKEYYGISRDVQYEQINDK